MKYSQFGDDDEEEDVVMSDSFEEDYQDKDLAHN